MQTAPPIENPNDNVETLASLRARAEQEVGWHQKRIERFTAQLGRPRSFYVILVLATLWGTYNVVAPAVGARAFDPPPFAWLQGFVGLGALLMTTIVLITQNRQTRHADQRSQLDLQVNLLAEQKAAKIIALLEELRRDIPNVHNRVDQLAEAMAEPVDPHAVLSAMEESKDE